MGAAAPGRDTTWGRGRGPGEHRPEAVAGAGGEEADGRQGDDRQVALLELRGAEVEAGRLVDQDPGLQLAIGDGLADVRLLGAGGDVPVDAAHVVAGLVRPGLAQLAAVAGDQAAVVALQQAVEPAVHGQLEPAQHLGRMAASEGEAERIDAWWRRWCAGAGHQLPVDA